MIIMLSCFNKNKKICKILKPIVLSPTEDNLTFPIPFLNHHDLVTAILNKPVLKTVTFFHLSTMTNFFKPFFVSDNGES